jgi:hypothetical protein
MPKNQKARLAIDRSCYQGESEKGNLMFDFNELELRAMVITCTALLAKLKKINGTPDTSA